MLKPLWKIGLKGTYFDIIKAIYEKPTTNIILSCEKLTAFPLRSRTKQECPPTTSIQHGIGSLSGSSQTKKKGIHNKEEVKLSLLADDMILYIENPKESTNPPAKKTLLGLIKEFSKVATYKIIFGGLLHFCTLIASKKMRN